MPRAVLYFACLFSLLASRSVAGAAAAEPWSQFRSARFGYCLSYPSELIVGQGLESARDCEFHTEDGAFSVSVEANVFVMEDESLDSRWRFELNVLGNSVTYKRKAATWYVLSGVTTDGAEYYIKIYAKGRTWVTFRITYPHTEAAKYDAWVTRIEKAFVPFAKRDGGGNAVAQTRSAREEIGAATLRDGGGAPMAAELELNRESASKGKIVEPGFISPPPLAAKIVHAPSPVTAVRRADVVASGRKETKSNGRLWHLPRPSLTQYPLLAKYGQLEGNGVVKVATDATGRVISVEIIRSANPILDAAIKEHARDHWHGPPDSSRTVPFAYHLQR